MEKLIPYRQGEKWGFCTSDKQVVIPCCYDFVNCFVDGLALVGYDYEEYDEERNRYSFEHSYQYINEQGKVVIDGHHKNADFSEGLAAFQDSDEQLGYINTKGEIVINTWTECRRQFPSYSCRNGIAITPNGLFDNYGKELYRTQTFWFTGQLSEDMLVIRNQKTNLMGFLSKDLTTLIECIFTSVEPFSCGMALVSVTANDRKRTAKQFIDKKGQTVLSGFADAKSFTDDLAPVCINDKWGYMDKRGGIVIPPTFDEAYNFNEGLACVELDNHLGYIDKSGVIRINCVFEKFEYDMSYSNSRSYSYYPSFKEGMAAVELRSQIGYIDPLGNIKIPIKYASSIPRNFSNGLAPVHSEDFFLGYIDKSGTEFWED